MPEIFNLNNSYNINNSKKISSKLTFEIGEKFSGKIIKRDEGNKATIKLVDGWEFEAEIDGDIDSLEQGFNKFEVEDFKDGKIKLKLVGANIKSDNSKNSDISNLLDKEGLKSEDTILLKSMLKFDISLTKENIKKVKSLINFNKDISENPKELNLFIEKYLDSKGISQNSLRGQSIANNLKEFLNVFKNLSNEDILLFLENNIDFTTENVEGYNNLFKGKGNIQDILKGIDKSLSDFSGNISEKGINNYIDKNTSIVESNENILKEKPVIDKLNSSIAKDIYEKQDNVVNNKIDILSILKSISGKTEDSTKLGLKEILNSKKDIFTSNEFANISSKIDKIDADEFLNVFKLTNTDLNETMLDNKSFNFELTKKSIEKTISNIFQKDIQLTDEESMKLKDIISLEIKDNKHSNLGLIKNNNLDENQQVLNNIKAKDSSVNEILNPKMVDQIRDEVNKIVEKDIDRMINKNTVANEKMTSHELIKDSIESRSKEGSNIIKDIISKLNTESNLSSKIISVLKDSIGDIKLFNKISQEYYYMDMPINIRERDYPCKLIVKDNRKDGKKIDSTNVKLVVTVKTSNLGVVDGYIKVTDKNINVDLKCEEKFVKLIDTAKEKLINNIQSIGFVVAVKVSKKKDEASIISCREFFNDNNISAIDIKV
ncbi:hypothetical protein [Clostridium septicum]|uniref:Flagellar hook-length control protein FliK n=1 Tax=Clostridium septicum TaxID=1504 RepID=A0A9N7JMZ3_CLOSE|nr:hypothetical protein [Clostridium septicum]AYE34914.1 hypothetical protein CP523_11105 [Clostridium septicum]MDU1313867.1 hypothetical protein [Clostridium septicum]QAS60308.1 hypothetical protein EI377_05895 [Clostridium septicum]UEC20437.1 hypothetical protein LK444_13725 [Clostridium septicum]USS01506.1 hypothetical protein NH397_03450 [Clostridium septicum]